MSTYYDIHCRTCDEGAGFRINHGDKQLLQLVNRIAQWAVLDDLINGPLNIDFKLWGDEGGGLRSFPAFAKAHLGHDVTLLDEYGRFFDKCGEWIKCPTCRSGAHCTLDRGHDGDHKP